MGPLPAGHTLLGTELEDHLQERGGWQGSESEATCQIENGAPGWQDTCYSSSQGDLTASEPRLTVGQRPCEEKQPGAVNTFPGDSQQRVGS
jgi:hypothetical protein